MRLRACYATSPGKPRINRKKAAIRFREVHAEPRLVVEAFHQGTYAGGQSHGGPSSEELRLIYSSDATSDGGTKFLILARAPLCYRQEAIACPAYFLSLLCVPGLPELPQPPFLGIGRRWRSSPAAARSLTCGGHTPLILAILTRGESCPALPQLFRRRVKISAVGRA